MKFEPGSHNRLGLFTRGPASRYSEMGGHWDGCVFIEEYKVGRRVRPSWVELVMLPC